MQFLSHSVSYEDSKLGTVTACGPLSERHPLGTRDGDCPDCTSAMDQVRAAKRALEK